MRAFPLPREYTHILVDAMPEQSPVRDQGEKQRDRLSLESLWVGTCSINNWHHKPSESLLQNFIHLKRFRKLYSESDYTFLNIKE